MFDFFTKFLKVFNSATKTWQIALAISLGFIMGLTPVSGLQTIVLLFIAFFINIPLGILFFMATNFAFIGYLFDPYFEAFGYYLLTLPELEHFWTALYNSGLARLSYFDNTIVLGSTLLSMVFAIPLFVILVITINRFRPALQSVFNRYKILRMFGLFKEDDGKKKPKAIRIWGVGLFGVIVGSFVIFAYFFMDTLFKWGIESSASSALQKQVIVERAQVDFQNARVVIEGFEVYKGDIREFYAKKMEANIDFNALLLFKTHIEELSIEGMRFDEVVRKKIASDTLSKSDNRAETKQEQADASRSKENNESLLPDVDTLIKNEELNTSKRYEEAKTLIDAASKKYETVVNDEFGPKYQKQKEKELEAIKNSSASITTLDDLKKLQKSVDGFKQGIERDKTRLHTLQKELAEDKRAINSAVDAIKKAKDDDFAALKSKYSFDKEGAFNIVGSLFGNDIQGYIETADEYYQMVSPYLESDEEEATPTQRHKGRWITFKQDTPNAAFIVYEAKVDGLYDTRPFSGVIHNISNDQPSVGKPITFTIKSDTPTMRNVVITGEDNRLGKQVVDTIQLNIAQIPENKMDMHLVKLNEANLAVEGSYTIYDGKTLQSKTHLRYKDTKLDIQNLDGRIAKSLRKEIQTTKSFTIDVSAHGAVLAPTMHITTSLEKVFKEAFDKAMAAEVKFFEEELNAALTKELNSKLGLANGDKDKLVDVEKLLKGEEGALTGLEKEGDALVKEKQNLLNKELEKQKKAAQKALDKEKKAAQKRAEDALKKAVPKNLNKFIKF